MKHNCSLKYHATIVSLRPLGSLLDDFQMNIDKNVCLDSVKPKL